MTLTLGILAGGRGERFGGRDKGWIEVEGRSQIQRVIDALGSSADRVVVSANRNLVQYRALGVEVVPDRWPDHPGPFAGVASLFSELRDDQLLTVPVDALRFPAGFVARMLMERGGERFHSVLGHDDDGMQPLFALYPAALAAHAIETFEAGKRSVRDWQHRFPIYPCRFEGMRFGNLNDPRELPA